MSKRLTYIKKAYHFQVFDSIFKRSIHVFINFQYTDYEKWLKKKFGNVKGLTGLDNPNFAAFSTQIEHPDHPTEWIIFIREFDWKIKDQGSLIHEIVHTIIKVWDNNSIPYNMDTQEFLAHSIANLYEDISRKIFKITK